MLAKHDVAGAVQSAVNKKQYKLASMLSNAGSSTVFKQILQQQLNDRVDVQDHARVLRLLAGVPVLEGRSCTQAFAHHLWYGSSPTASIADTLDEYEKANPHEPR